MWRILLHGSRVRFLPDDTAEPTTTYEERLDLSVGGLELELHHDRGETDDHTWAWIPSLRAVAVGDFVAWVFPNAGNPQKVQRYPVDWARALRSMISLEPELLLIDELSLGLAPLVVQELLEVVEGLKRTGVTMVIVEQSVNVALSIADRAVFMARGRVRFEGAASDLLDRDDLLRAVFLSGEGA